MARDASEKRIDRASRTIAAPPDAVYRALTEADSVAAWRPPAGMTATIFAFDPRAGGVYRMAFSYDDAAAAHGKTTDNADIFEGRFAELVPGRRVVEIVTFESDDPTFAGAMTITTTLTPVDGGTEIAIACENVPEGISAADHAAGMASSLANLAAFVERSGKLGR